MKNTVVQLTLTLFVILNASIAQAGEPYQQFLGHYDGLLKKYVHTTEQDGIVYNGVEYDNWASDPRHKQALNLLLAQQPQQFEADENMAFWINAYNFLTIELILREDERETIKNLGSLFTSPWKAHSWTLGDGKDYTLDQIEHEILRPMGDARIHFAINCASVSCPDLRTEAYRAEKLDSQLNEQVKLTLANAQKGLRIEGQTIYVSKIFDWFSEDFNSGHIKAWLNEYKKIDQNASITFMDYDWSLNKVK